MTRRRRRLRKFAGLSVSPPRPAHRAAGGSGEKEIEMIEIVQKEDWQVIVVDGIEKATYHKGVKLEIVSSPAGRNPTAGWTPAVNVEGKYYDLL